MTPSYSLRSFRNWRLVCCELHIDTVFEICFDVQLTKRQPPIPKASQAAAWSHRYIGYWIGKTEGSPIGLWRKFGRWNDWIIPLAKVVDFEPLGALFGLGGLEADLAPIWRSHRQRLSSQFTWVSDACLIRGELKTADPYHCCLAVSMQGRSDLLDAPFSFLSIPIVSAIHVS